MPKQGKSTISWSTRNQNNNFQRKTITTTSHPFIHLIPCVSHKLSFRKLMHSSIKERQTLIWVLDKWKRLTTGTFSSPLWRFLSIRFEYIGRGMVWHGLCLHFTSCSFISSYHRKLIWKTLKIIIMTFVHNWLPSFSMVRYDAAVMVWDWHE